MLRSDMQVRVTDWNNDECATEFLRRGLRDFEASTTQAASIATVKDDVSNALTAFDTDYPIQATLAFCGDSIVDTEFGEQCDPPDGVTCDDSCETIP